MDKIRFAFAGFRHAHIFDILSAVRANPELELVAACEEDPQTRDELDRSGKVTITHHTIEQMLTDTPCDVVAIGDTYGRRGAIAIAALAAGAHVISDKPLCTSLAELDQIQDLALGGNRALGLQLDLRGVGTYLTARKIIASGQIGEVQTVAFSGQHPLLWGSRPGWYFESGAHGGTINDLFIHAADAVEWLTGRRIDQITAARAWNSSFVEAPGFQIGAQVMLRLDNDGGVLGDVSYLAPSRCGYSVSSYWRFTVHGAGGLLEWDCTGKTVSLATHDDATPREIPAEPNIPRAYLDDFLLQVRTANRILDRAADVSLTTRQVLRASSIALLAQQAADKGRHNISLTK
jgi:predicted dehydrogenase